MAKRSRGTSRPGQRRPVQKAPARPTSPRPAGGLTEAEEQRAAELEARMVAEERAAEELRGRARDRRPVEPVRGRSGAGLLAVRAAEEYTYVVRDVRRIVSVAAVLFAILAVIYGLRSVGVL
jgi:hypothetical protein